MRQYLNALKYVMDRGVDKEDRTGVGTRAVFGMQMRYDLSLGFPAVTTKKLAFNTMKAELLWFLSGSSDVRELQKLGCRIWDANAEAPYWKDKARFPGDLGRVYGVQWRSWQAPDGQTIDQIHQVVERIKKNPYDRRLIVAAWNPGEIEQMALPPCHTFFQFFVEPVRAEPRIYSANELSAVAGGGKLSLQMYQRSCDMFLGVPFNIASYSLLLQMMAQVTGLQVGDFVHTLGDTHIYLNHFDQVREQLSREPFSLPRLWLNPEIKNIDDFKMEDIELRDYQFHPPIKAQMAI